MKPARQIWRFQSKYPNTDRNIFQTGDGWLGTATNQTLNGYHRTAALLATRRYIKKRFHRCLRNTANE